MNILEQWNWLFGDMQFFVVLCLPMAECIMIIIKETEDELHLEIEQEHIL